MTLSDRQINILRQDLVDFRDAKLFLRDETTDGNQWEILRYRNQDNISAAKKRGKFPTAKWQPQILEGVA